MKEFEEKELADIGEFKQLKGLADLAGEVAELSAARDLIDGEIRAKRESMKALMEKVPLAKKGSYSVRAGLSTISYIKPNPKKTLVRELLILAGVTEKQIKKGTKETPVAPYVQVTTKKEKK